MSQTAELHPQLLQESVDTTGGVLVSVLGSGIAFASAGQALLLITLPGSTNEGSMQVLAGIMLIAGCLLFGISTRRYLFFSTRLELPADNAAAAQPIEALSRARLWLWFVADIALIAIYIFAARGESPLVVLLWLASILALFVSQSRPKRLALPHVEKAERIYWVGLTLVLVVTLITRVYHLTTLPYNLDGDFADFGLQARALATGQQQQIFAFGWASIPMLGYLPAWLGMKLFGTGLAGLNASGVIEGLLTIVGVYLLGRDLFKARVGLFAAALLAVSYTHLAASRQSAYIDPVVFMLFAIYFMLVGLRENRGWAVVVSGLLSAFCMQLYYSGRLVFPIIAVLLLFLLIFHRAWLRTRLNLILLWFIAILVTLGPMLLVFLQSPDAFISRAREVFILNPDVVTHTENVYHVNTILSILMDQANHTVLLFHYYPDKGTQFAIHQPFLDPFTATLFTLGLGYAFFHWRNLGSWVLVSWTVLGLVIGCLLTVNAPFWPRLMILLPPCAILAAIALNLVYELLCRVLIGMNDRLVPAASLAVLFFLIWVGWQNWNIYVLSKGSFAYPRTYIARYMNEQPPDIQAHLVSSFFGYKDREFEFLIPGRLVDNLTPDQVEGGALPPNSTKMLIVSPEIKQEVVRLKELYPAAVVETHQGNAPDDIAFYVVHLP